MVKSSAQQCSCTDTKQNLIMHVECLYSLKICVFRPKRLTEKTKTSIFFYQPLVN
jgi:hypothetical protein